jgi:hypothetical protein
MALEGSFKDFGLAEIFQLIGLQKKTGVLTVKGGDDSQVVTVSFEKGMVAFADEYQRGEKERLGSLLLRANLISAEDLQRAVQTQKETLQRLGHVLVQMNFISQKDLSQALQSQVKETVYRLFRLKEGSFLFSTESIAYDKDMYKPIAAEFLLMEGVRMIDEWPIIEKKIPSFDIVYEKDPDHKERAAGQGGLPGEEGRPDLKPKEETILNLVDGMRTVQEIIDVGKQGEFESCKNLYSLLSVGLIRPTQEAVPVRATRATRQKSGIPVGDIAAVGVAAAALLGLLLFNPWNILTLRYDVRQSREQVGTLVDDVKIHRLELALNVFYLEKQSYPHSLEKLVEDRILTNEDVMNSLGRPFEYRAGDKEYMLGGK